MIKRLISVILCVILSTTVRAADKEEVSLFTDIFPESNVLYEAVSELGSLGIVKGYEDGTFKPNKEVTRGEMILMTRRMMNPDDSVGNVSLHIYNSEKNTIEEAPEDWWVRTPADTLKAAGVINGYKDGELRLENNITYNECVKILICMLGYGKNAMYRAEWPDGYIDYAKDLNIFEGVAQNDFDAKATRGDVAIMISNAISLPRNLISECGAYGGEKGKAEGISFEEVLTAENPYMQNTSEKAVDGMSFAKQATRLPAGITIVPHTELIIKNETQNINLYFSKIDKTCDYYVTLKGVSTSIEERNDFELKNVGPVSLKRFTITNVPKGAYELILSASPCASDVEGVVVIE